MGTATI